MVGDGEAPLRLPKAAEPAGPTPGPTSPEDRRTVFFAVLLCLGSLGAVLVGLAVTLARQIRKKGRQKGATALRKDR